MKFDLQLALECARTIRDVAAGVTPPDINNASSDTQALTQVLPDGRTLVAFPGSASLRDWLTDFNIWRKPWEPGDPFAGGDQLVHRGFRSAYRSIHDELETRLPHGASLVLTGHSLGGALATLAASALDGLFHIDTVITFGSPRVGNRKFAVHYNSRFGERTARVVNAHDPVPYSPWRFGRYRHVATQVFLPGAGGVRIDEPFQVMAGELASLVTAERHSAFGIAAESKLIVEHHHLSRYIAKLEALA